ncbi:MAG TPA: glycosyltransferase family 9 protein, partial [Blastocatellia bacterium]|nr:glycosyltransferase family 9 protein [Blastocatellia bacterium]
KHNSRTKGEAAYTSVLRQLGMKTSLEWTPQPSHDENARFEQLLERGGTKRGAPVVVLYAAEATAHTGWPVEKFAELAAQFVALFGARIAVADIPADSGFTNAVADLLPADAIELKAPAATELLAALARASLVVTDDAGVARFSARLGTPTVDLGSHPAKEMHGAPAGVPGRLDATTEDVFVVASELLQKSRTATLFRR